MQKQAPSSSLTQLLTTHLWSGERVHSLRRERRDICEGAHLLNWYEETTKTHREPLGLFASLCFPALSSFLLHFEWAGQVRYRREKKARKNNQVWWCFRQTWRDLVLWKNCNYMFLIISACFIFFSSLLFWWFSNSIAVLRQMKHTSFYLHRDVISTQTCST